MLVSIYLFVLGTAVGSFLNVVSDRLPQDRSLNGRSHCEFCKKTLRWYDLVPILSFLFIGAKCRYCKKKLSWWYFLAEIGTGLAFVSTYFVMSCSRFCPAGSFPPVLPRFIDYGRVCALSGALPACHLLQSASFWFFQNPSVIYVSFIIYYLLLISVLIAIFLSDLKYHIIPDQLVIFFTILSIPYVILHPIDSIIGAGIVSGILYAMYVLTKKKGMGFGDVKFAIPMGLILGAKAGFFGLYLAFMIGGMVGILLLISARKGLKSRVAFGPFLIVGFICMFFFKDIIFSFLKSSIGY
jgi:prepilin signal peptidase PulO-like enzyme (type II secretory pathway)